MPSTKQPAPVKPPKNAYQPEMRVTRFDSVRAVLIALFLGTTVTTAAVTALYAVLKPSPQQTYIPIELPDADGGFEDGQSAETPDVQNDAPPLPTATPVEVETDVQEIRETLDALTDLSTQAITLLPEQIGDAADNAGPLGSSDGSGSRPLGVGGGTGGVSREKRWLVRFGENAPLEEYAKQLDFFGIELGVITPAGKLVYASRLSAAVPNVREVESGAGESRLYFQWRGGARRVADRKLFQKAGVNTGQAPILHFYSKAAESNLAQLEYEASNKVEVTRIRRTFFDVVANAKGYRFEVDKVVLFEQEP